MLNLFLTILFLIFTTKGYSFGVVEQASHCDDISKKINSEWFIDSKYDYIPHLINRTKRKDIVIENIDFKVPQYSGLNIKTKNNSYPICFEALTVPTAILIEEKELYDAFDRRMEKHLYFSIHAMVNCGTPCTHSHVYSVSFYKDESHFWGLTIRENEYPSMWFVDHLTFKEAYGLHRYGFEMDIYWRGKWYTID